MCFISYTYLHLIPHLTALRGLIAKRAPRRVDFPTSTSTNPHFHLNIAAHQPCPQSNCTLVPLSPLQQRQQLPHPILSATRSHNSSKPLRASPSSSYKGQSTSPHQKTGMMEALKAPQTPIPKLHPTKPRSENSCSRTTRPRTRMIPSG